MLWAPVGKRDTEGRVEDMNGSGAALALWGSWSSARPWMRFPCAAPVPFSFAYPNRRSTP